MEENNPKVKPDALEAVLFAYGEPISLKKLGEIFKADKEKVKLSAADLKHRLEERGSGITVFESGERLTLVTLPIHGPILETVLKKEFAEELTPAAQETLAVIAYTGPVSRSEIEYIRGVNSSFTIRNLMIRGLIEREADTRRANGFCYKLSFDCLKHLGLSRLEELPDYEKHKLLTDTFRAGNKEEGSEVKNIHEV